MAGRREFLFWTRVPRNGGGMVTVKVFVDIDECLAVARRSARNKGRKAKQGAIEAEALAGDIDLTKYNGPKESL